MRSPKEMEIIEIDITNACVKRCSNCSRFCGHHRQSYYMDFNTFKKAVDSLDGYDGIVGIIGGEPTLHPEFEKFSKYIASKRLTKSPNKMRFPIYDMLYYTSTNLLVPLETKPKVGLSSSVPKTYYKYIEVISDSYGYQILNDHKNTCLHQALLMSRKELGITDKEWIKKRDKCWVQNKRSASITPKGAFFCEIAGSLDMLFDGPGGWPIEKNWWKRSPKDFTEQLHWCELCSACLDVPKRLSTDGRDDVTPLIYEKLKSMNSPKALKKNLVIHTKKEYQLHKKEYKTFEDEKAYMVENNSIRIRNSSDILPRNFTILNKEEFCSIYNKNKPSDWIIVGDDKKKSKNLASQLSKFVINPGCLYKSDDTIIFNVLASSIKNVEKIDINNIFKYYPKNKIIEISDNILLESITLKLLRNLQNNKNIKLYK